MRAIRCMWGSSGVAFGDPPGDDAWKVRGELIARVEIVGVGGLGVPSPDKADIVLAAQIGQGALNGGVRVPELKAEKTDSGVDLPYLPGLVILAVVVEPGIDFEV